MPYAYEEPRGGPSPLELVEARLARLPGPVRRELELAVALFGSRVASLLTIGRTTPFAELDSERQDAMLARWARSPVARMRTIHAALRRLVLAVWSADPEVQRGIGYLGPLHRRSPEVPWEGPLAGVTSDDEPVARASDPAQGAPAPPGERERRSTADSLREGARIVCDAVVIGSGAGGAVVAARLAEAGRDVVVLEAGSHLRGRDFDEREGPSTERLYADGGSRATDDLSVSIFQGAAVGGGTTVNWLVMLRTPDGVLEEWASRHGVEGMTPREMAPVFDLVEREVHARRVPDDAHSPNNRIILDGARALGWRAAPAVINAKGCVRSGFCGLGCRYDAKQGALMTYVPRALARGARLLADARAERIEVVERASRGITPRKRVHVTVTDPVTRRPRLRLTVEAPVVVLAAGAVETPVLLERSGLGGGGVGRFLRLHPTTAVAGRYDHLVHASAGIPLSAVCDEFSARDANGYGFWIECPPMHPMLAAVALPGIGARHRALLREYPRLGTLMRSRATARSATARAATSAPAAAAGRASGTASRRPTRGTSSNRWRRAPVCTSRRVRARCARCTPTPSSSARSATSPRSVAAACEASSSPTARCSRRRRA